MTAPAAILGAVAAWAAAAPPGSGTAWREAGRPARVLVVTYFVTDVRCPSCLKIEAWTREAVEHSFAKPLRSGRLVFRLVNIEEPANAHFWDDYRLITKSVVLSDTVDGTERRWKHLDRIWILLHEGKPAFQRYVRDEIAAWLKPG